MRTPLVLLGAALIVGVTGCGSSSGPGRHDPPAAPAAAADQGPVQVEIAQSSLGPILTDQNGRTLYAFVNDKDGTSSCTGSCIATWPALISRTPVDTGTGGGQGAAVADHPRRRDGPGDVRQLAALLLRRRRRPGGRGRAGRGRYLVRGGRGRQAHQGRRVRAGGTVSGW